MHIVFEIKGKQYNLTKDDQILYIDYQKKNKPGDKIVFDKVLSADDKFGQPYLPNAKITGEIIGNRQRKKIIIFKYKAKKRYKKKQGHRARYTEVKVLDIVGIS